MPPKRERSESVESYTLADVELLMVEAPVHHAFNELMSNSPESVAFLHGPRFSNAMKEAAIATNAAITFNITTDQAVEELRRFLALKVFLRDDKTEKLGPSSVMEIMWQAAILDTQLHQELQAVLPFFIHHRPASDAEAEARKVSLITMESVYHRFFGRDPLGVPVGNPAPLAENRPRKKPRQITDSASRPVRRRVSPHVVRREVIELSDGEDEAPRNNGRSVPHQVIAKNEEDEGYKIFLEDDKDDDPLNNGRHVPRRLSRQVSPHQVAIKFENEAIIMANNDDDDDDSVIVVKDEVEVIVLSDEEDDVPRFNARSYTAPPPLAATSFEDAEPPKFVTLFFDVGYAHPKLRATMRETASFQRIYRQIKDRFFKGHVGEIAIWFDEKVVDKLDTPRSLKMNDGVTLLVQSEEMVPEKL